MNRAATALTETIVLALWLGAALFFVAEVAPAAFAVLPTRTLAGAVVGRLLAALFVTGALIGLVVLLLELRMSPRAATGRMVAGLVTAVSCIIAQLAIAPRIKAVRASIHGPVDSLPATDARRVAFGHLHGLSVLWLGIAALAALIALALAARAQWRES